MSYEEIKNHPNNSFFAFENNSIDYLPVRNMNKKHNIKKCNIWKNHNNKIDDFLVLPKSSYQANIFGGNSSQYIDFELPKLNRHTFQKFVLKFTINNTDNVNDAWINVGPYIIDHVSLIVNSNAMGADINQYNIMWHNLERCGKIDGQSIIPTCLSLQNSLNMKVNDFSVYPTISNWRQCVAGITVSKLSNKHFLIELPISLSGSDILASSIQDNIIIRVYFKNSITVIPALGMGTNGVLDNLLTISNVKLYLRCKELTNQEIVCYNKMPMITFPFTKKIVHKYTLNSFIAGQEMSIQLSDFHSVSTGCFVFFTSQSDNNTEFFPINTCLPYHFALSVDNVYINDSIGKNINNGIKLDMALTSYILEENFPNFSTSLQSLCYQGQNDGYIHYFSFCGDGQSSTFENVYTGGVKFNNNTIYFTPINDAIVKTVVLNIMYCVPAYLQVENGSINEYYA